MFHECGRAMRRYAGMAVWSTVSSPDRGETRGTSPALLPLPGAGDPVRTGADRWRGYGPCGAGRRRWPRSWASGLLGPGECRYDQAADGDVPVAGGCGPRDPGHSRGDSGAFPCVLVKGAFPRLLTRSR